MTIKKQDIAIIGSGISGVSIGNMLNHIANVKIFEKSRGVGGRIATRYTRNFEFDHGAQFFTIKTDGFKKFIQPLINEGIVGIWNARFVEINRNKIIKQSQWDAEYPHYIGSPRMNVICKYLAQKLSIELNVDIQKIVKTNRNKWQLFDKNDIILGEFDWVISSVPAHQATTFFPKEFYYYRDLERVKMSGCYSLMLGFHNKLNMSWDAALVKHSNISWISNNSSKPGREPSNTLVVLASNKWADKHIDYDLEYIKSKMIKSISEIIDCSNNDLVESVIHRWRYANIGKNHRYQYLLDQQNKLAAIGDWCIQGKIEKAFMSAELLYKQIIGLVE